MRRPASLFTAIGLCASLGCHEGSPATPLRGSDQNTAQDSSPASGNNDDVSTDSLHDEGSARPQAKRPEPELPRPSFPAPNAGQTVKLPAGTLLLGSPVEDPFRVQFAEADQLAVELHAFEMDALPYPNDPAQAFHTGVTRQDAEALCRGEGKRLCTEVEWEWACESADARRYPSGQVYDPADYPSADPLLPASPLGVFGLGRIEEWTQSAWGTELDQLEKAAVRGHSAALGISDVIGKRCAFRSPRLPSETHTALGFRCCRGEANAFAQEIEKPRPPFSVYSNIKPEKFEAVIRSIPQIAALHDQPHMFSDGDIRAVMARRGTDRAELGKSGVKFVWKPLRWIPRQGTELWVAVGRSQRHSFIVALHEAEDNEVYVHASSLILWNQPVPLALGYREGHRDDLFWAPCWGCRDGGAITFDDATGEVVITHKW